MSRPVVPLTPALSASFFAIPPGRPCSSLADCAPVAGPRKRPVVSVPVDEELVWVTPVPATLLGAARPPSSAAFVHLCVRLAQDLTTAYGDEFEAAALEADLVDAAARAVAAYLDDLPDLPFVGEPFGGEEGSD